MKKILFAALSLGLMGLVASCGSSRKTTAYTSSDYPNYTAGAKNSNRVVVTEDKLDECEEESMKIEGGLLRAYGSAIDEDKDFARQSAALNARGQLASAIKTLVTNIMSSYRSTAKKTGKSISESNREQTIDLVAEEMMANTSIICSKRYSRSDGTYECTVCVGMMKPVDDAVKEAVLSEDAKLGVEFDEQRFRNSKKEELERFRAEKKGGK